MRSATLQHDDPLMSNGLSAPWIALGLLLVVALYLCWQMLLPFLNVLLWAMVLVVVFYPIHGRLVERIGHAGWAAAVSTALVVVTILGPVSMITVAVVDQVRDTASRLETNPVQLFSFDSPILGPAL